MKKKIFLFFYYYHLFGGKYNFLITTTNYNEYLHVLIDKKTVGYIKYKSFLSRKIRNDKKFFVLLKNNKLICRDFSMIWNSENKRQSKPSLLK